MRRDMNQTVVIGGGPGGFFAAIEAAKNSPSESVLLCEASSKFLSKVLISGGGRCNVTNHTLDPAVLTQGYPRGGVELRGAFSRFGVSDTISWFKDRGVSLKVEPDNRMFPTTDNSETIANCLIREAKSAGVMLQLRTRICHIEQDAESKRYTIMDKAGKKYEASRVVLATGSSRAGYDLATTLGHTLVPPVPSLFTFEISDPLIQDLQGLSFPKARLSLDTGAGPALKRTGPLLVTHWGLSGPAVIQLSSLAARQLSASRYSGKLTVNFLAPTNAETVLGVLQKVRKESPSKLADKHCPLEVPKRFWSRVVQLVVQSEGKRWQEISNKQLNEIAAMITQGNFQITGKGQFKEEFVTCGGVSLKEVNFKTMESKLCPGLHFAGEILDIDGITGGFNFQCAWTTGWIAGNPKK
jgi:predicted Rossmann fold flavoprotein